MADDRPVLDQVNLVASDLDATLAFYRLLGLDVPDAPPEWPAGSGAVHAGAATDGRGARPEFDNVPMASIWHAGWRDGSRAGEAARPGGPLQARVVLGFSLTSREAVDDAYARLVGAGHAGRQPPYDAFWGARYAVVADPDGNDVGLMSPIDAARKYVPEP